MLANEIASGRTTTISTNTQPTPPSPKGLSSRHETSAASSGNSTVIANWASWRMKSSSCCGSEDGRRPTTTPAATAAGNPDSDSWASQPPYIKNKMPSVS